MSGKTALPARLLPLWQTIWKRRYRTSSEFAVGAFVAMFVAGLLYPTPWLAQTINYAILLPAMLWLLPEMRRSALLLVLLLIGIGGYLAALLLGTLSAGLPGEDSFHKQVLVAAMHLANCIALGVAGRFDRHLPVQFGRFVSLAAAAAALLLLSVGAADLSFGETRLHGIPGYQWVLNPNALAAVYAICFAVAVAHFVNRNVAAAERGVAFVVCTLLVVTVALTESRGAMLGCLAAAAIALFALPRRVVLGLCAFSALALVLLLVFAPAWIGYFAARGDSYRLALWAHYFELSLDRLWLGHGLNFDPRFLLDGNTIYTPHNMLLAALVRGGLVGLLFLIGTVAAAALAGLSAARRGWWTPLITLAASFVMTMVDHELYPANFSYYSYVYWLPLGLAAYAASWVVQAGSSSRPSKH